MSKSIVFTPKFLQLRTSLYRSEVLDVSNCSTTVMDREKNVTLVIVYLLMITSESEKVLYWCLMGSPEFCFTRWSERGGKYRISKRFLKSGV
jgi:hypothetical protein